MVWLLGPPDGAGAQTREHRPAYIVAVPCRALVRPAAACCASPAHICDLLGGGWHRRLESFPIVFCAPCGGRWCGRSGRRTGQARGHYWLRRRHLGGCCHSLRLCFRCRFGARCAGRAGRHGGAARWLGGGRSDGAGGFEVRDRLHQLLRLAFEALCRCGAFFDQCRVLLGGAVHLGNGFTHLADPLGFARSWRR